MNEDIDDLCTTEQYFVWCKEQAELEFMNSEEEYEQQLRMDN